MVESEVNGELWFEEHREDVSLMKNSMLRALPIVIRRARLWQQFRNSEQW